MKPGADIDSALRTLGTARPPAGMERRIHARLDHAPHRTGAHLPIAAAVIAAGVLVTVITLSPSDNSRSGNRVDHTSAENYTRGTGQQMPSSTPVQEMERQILAKPHGAFGAASAIHVPDTPLTIRPAAAGRQHNLSTPRTPTSQRIHRNRSSAPEAPTPASGKTPINTSGQTAVSAAESISGPSEAHPQSQSLTTISRTETTGSTPHR